MSINARGVVNAEKSLHIRDKPNGEIVGYLMNGEPVHITDHASTGKVEWFRVKATKMRMGWVAARYIDADKRPPDVEPIVPVVDTSLPSGWWLLAALAAIVALVASAFS